MKAIKLTSRDNTGVAAKLRQTAAAPRGGLYPALAGDGYKKENQNE